MADTLHKFIFKDLDIRGQHCLLEESWQAMIKDRHYPTSVRTLLGELTVMAVFLAQGMKHTGRLSVQIQGEGPIALLLVDVTHDLKLRGMAKLRETVDDHADFNALLGDGKIMVTLENTQTNHHYQSFVPRSGDTMSDTFSHFLTQSEQQPAKAWLAASATAIGGVLIEKMPAANEQDADGWNRITHLSHTATEQELTQLSAQALLTRLFHEENIQLFDGQILSYDCLQNQQKVLDMLVSLGEQEVRKVLAEQGELVIHNEMCNEHVRISEAEIDALFGTKKAQKH